MRGDGALVAADLGDNRSKRSPDDQGYIRGSHSRISPSLSSGAHQRDPLAYALLLAELRKGGLSHQIYAPGFRLQSRRDRQK